MGIAIDVSQRFYKKSVKTYGMRLMSLAYRKNSLNIC